MYYGSDLLYLYLIELKLQYDKIWHLLRDYLNMNNNKNDNNNHTF